MNDTSKRASLPAVRLAMPETAVREFEITEARWRTLVDAVFPSAKSPEAVVLALDYCRANGLDIMKRPIHIVPMWNSTLRREVETIWPGIASYRIVAHRSESFAGMDDCAFGETKTETFKGEILKRKQGQIVSRKPVEATVEYPEWAQMTVYRIVQGEVRRFPGPKVRYKAMYGDQAGSGVPNEKWASDAFWMLEKCAESAALRRAFPEALGDWQTIEEAERTMVDVTPQGGAEESADDLIDDTADKGQDKGEDFDDGLVSVVDEVGEVSLVDRAGFVDDFKTMMRAIGGQNPLQQAQAAVNTREANLEGGKLHPVVADELAGFEAWFKGRTGKTAAEVVAEAKAESEAAAKDAPKQEKEPAKEKPASDVPAADEGDDDGDQGDASTGDADDGEGQAENGPTDPEKTAAGASEAPAGTGGGSEDAPKAPAPDATAAIAFPKGVPTMPEITEWIGKAESALAKIDDTKKFRSWAKNNMKSYERIKEAMPAKVALIDDLMARFD